MFLDSVRRRVVDTAMYVRDSVVLFVYSDTSINDDQVHRPPSVEPQDDEDVFYDACLQSDVSHRCEVISYQEDAYRRIPEKLWCKKALANMENYNKHCFMWAVTRALNPVGKNPQWITKTLREQTRQYNWTNIDFPTPLNQIELFERNNNVLVNVFGYNEEERCVYPLRISTGKHAGRVLLMLIGDESKGHYVVIKCMSRLLCGRTGKKTNKRFYCNKCLEDFSSDVALQKHVVCCEKLEYPSCGFSNR